ncbi:unnamed protein product [Ilex paraguariensis]|uniref:Peptidase M3A/M3B catalytic domain-containing protein n=1 Tax=Ilex paraguariensis TaxID=185542 RepID=A0ABC8QUH8_9AQUA
MDDFITFFICPSPRVDCRSETRSTRLCTCKGTLFLYHARCPSNHFTSNSSTAFATPPPTESYARRTMGALIRRPAAYLRTGLKTIHHFRTSTAPQIKETGLYSIDILKTPNGFRGFVDEAVERSDELVNCISRMPSSVEIIRAMDEISNTVCSVIDSAELCRHTHPDREFVEEAIGASMRMNEYLHVRKDVLWGNSDFETLKAVFSATWVDIMYQEVDMVCLMCAGYYSYLYAKCFAATIWQKICQEDPLSLATGSAIRTKFLQHGGAKDPADILNDLTGDGILKYQHGGIIPDTASLFDEMELTKGW